MMKRLVVYSVISLFVFTFNSAAEAQLFNRLKNRTKEAAEKKLEEKAAEKLQRMAEQSLERSWIAIFGDTTEARSPRQRFPFSLGNNVTTEPVYHFDTVTYMEIKTINKDGKSDPPVTMEMHFNKDETYTGTKFHGQENNQDNGDLFVIYDFKNSAMVMLISQNKDKFSFAYTWNQSLNIPDSTVNDQKALNGNEVDKWHGYKKIGHKDIAGYSCDGFQSLTEDSNTEIWVTREETYGMGTMFRANSYSKQLRGKIPENYPYGMMMEMRSENLRNGDKLTIKVTDINKNADVNYTMDDYPNMSSNPKKG